MPHFDDNEKLKPPRVPKSPLTVKAIENFKPKSTSYRKFDQKGLYIEVFTNGSKLWRYRYRFDGKEKRLALGAFPEVSLATARDLRDQARVKLREGIDPGVVKKKEQAAINNTFQSIGQEWTEHMRESWSASHVKDVESRLRVNAYPYLGDKDVRVITPAEVLSVVRRVEANNKYELAKRVLGCCSQIFRYAVATSRADSDPCRDLRGALKPYTSKSFAAITRPKEAGALMRAIDAYRASGIVQNAMKLSALTFCRPGEIRKAEWAEVDLDEKEWRIPAHKMKAKQEHRVPLSRQSIEILEQMKAISGNGVYVFPNGRTKDKPMSENAVLAALRNMGYTKEQMTPHGFRAMASTLLNELGNYRPDIIEAQLAHKEGDKVRAAYNRAQYMQERRQLMQDWADYLDSLRDTQDDAGSVVLG